MGKGRGGLDSSSRDMHIRYIPDMPAIALVDGKRYSDIPYTSGLYLYISDPSRK